jgi:hypothetical protein
MLRKSLLGIAISILVLTGCNHGKNAADKKAEEDAAFLAASAKAEQERQAAENAKVADLMRQHNEAEQASAKAESARVAAEREASAEASKQTMLAKVKERLFDPDSAQFRNVQVAPTGDTMCGEVNSKNKMGGYVGFKQFIIYHGIAVMNTADDFAIYELAEKETGCFQ